MVLGFGTLTFKVRTSNIRTDSNGGVLLCQFEAASGRFGPVFQHVAEDLRVGEGGCLNPSFK